MPFRGGKKEYKRREEPEKVKSDIHVRREVKRSRKKRGKILEKRTWKIIKKIQGTFLKAGEQLGKQEQIRRREKRNETNRKRLKKKGWKEGNEMRERYQYNSSHV